MRCATCEVAIKVLNGSDKYPDTRTIGRKFEPCLDMIARIVERKRDNGDIYYIIQRRLFWTWWNYKVDEICDLDGGNIAIHSFSFAYSSAEQAKATLERTQRAYNHKGVAIYPTIKENIFYTLFGAKKHDKYDWYVTLIYGSYENCCKQIDEYLTAKKNRKYKKVVDV